MTTKGLYFDGTKQQYASFDATGKGLPTGNADRTLEFWIRTPAKSGATDNHQPIIDLGKQEYDGSAFGVHLEVRQGVAYLRFWGHNADLSLANHEVGALPDDQWHFVAITYTDTGGMLGVYLDGRSQGSFPIVTSSSGGKLNTSVGICHIGGNPKQRWYFTGSVSGIRIWNVVRTATEIQGDMTNPCSITSNPNLVASIPLDEGQGTTFTVQLQQASGVSITTGSLTNAADPNDTTKNPLWNKPLVPNPDPISDGIWFVIQNKSDVVTDITIPAARSALTVEPVKKRVLTDKIPLDGNYEPFLWRCVSNADGSYKLVNKQYEGYSLDFDTVGLVPLLRTAQTANWSLTPANPDNWGTNAYFITNTSQPLKRLAHLGIGYTDDTDIQQIWLLQPMEVVLGYCVPVSNDPTLCPFTKQLYSEFGVTFYGTITTSDWAMLNTHLVIRNVIKALQASRRSSDTFKGWKVLVISGFDNNPESVVGYPMIKGVFDEQWVQRYWGGTHCDVSQRIVNVAESLMCYRGVSYHNPPFLTSREFDQVVHEFGHAIDYAILRGLPKDQQSEEQQEAKDFWGGAPEWFPIQVQSWLNNASSYPTGAQHRSELTSAASSYLDTIFNTSNDWLPPRWLRNRSLDTFELRAGGVLARGQALISTNFDYVLYLQPGGNLTVSDANGGPLLWGSHQNLKIELDKIQSVSMTDNGHLQLLGGSGTVLKTLPENATPAPGPDARLIVSKPDSESPTSYLKIIDKSGTTVWKSS